MEGLRKTTDLYEEGLEVYVDDDGELILDALGRKIGIVTNPDSTTSHVLVDSEGRIETIGEGYRLLNDGSGNLSLVDEDGDPIEGVDGNSIVFTFDFLINTGVAPPLDVAAGYDAGQLSAIGGLNDFINISIDATGTITGIPRVDNRPDGERGRAIVIAQLVIATFDNPTGLEKRGNSLYSVSANSGEPVFNRPGENGAGDCNVGGLEMSNVDLAAEFTDMIVTQRGFQANSRVITVTDTMLEELINLKR
jgi:flagellar hook protein FlgE